MRVVFDVSKANARPRLSVSLPADQDVTLNHYFSSCLHAATLPTVRMWTKSRKL